MRIYSVYDAEFKPYGKVIEGYDIADLQAAMLNIPMPEEGVAYEASIASLEYTAVFGKLQNNVYGGMPMELGMCWGYNSKLNCLEYHRDSELNIGAYDFVLLVARRDEIQDGQLDSSKVKAFRAPAGVVVEVYATTLHYAPCHTDASDGFRVAIGLPKGTNGTKPMIELCGEEDRWLMACNKWLLAHPDADEAKQGAYVGITGENIDLAKKSAELPGGKKLLITAFY